MNEMNDEWFFFQLQETWRIVFIPEDLGDFAWSSEAHIIVQSIVHPKFLQRAHSLKHESILVTFFSIEGGKKKKKFSHWD